MTNYTVMNLSMISRLAILENAGKTGEAIENLVAVLRYRGDSSQSMSTIDGEMKIIEKMFMLHQLKKGPSFSGIVNNELKKDKCYLKKGMLVAFIDLAISKDLAKDKEKLEVIVSVTVSGDRVTLRVKDNGAINVNALGESLDEKYDLLTAAYSKEIDSLDIKIKPGIGTIVRIDL